ncbi:cytidylate kinase-like family protein [Acidihalobacter prosperus]|uniref:Cytidylate kinase n=1 Tax=Acidihalobacter prosperus TaxID=160660 RepID=A0A1A6C736_9GAMM|nr:cytidylate kinase-like family protein [Acidihalobacter prosperus]OBS10376.1 hypothetical protein Thpro_020092 [Acidihalobacter prosperus]
MTRSALERYLLTLLHESGVQAGPRAGPLVAISRDYGAGAGVIAPLLAARIGVAFYDHAVIDGVIERIEGDPALMRELDESAPPGLISRLLHGYGNIPSSDEYAKALVELVLAIARQGGVILGRGVHLIASIPDMYRVYLRASPETCIARLAQRDSLDHQAAADRWHRIEADRRTYLKHHFGRTRDAFDDFDLVVNTDHVDTLERVVDIIVAGLHARQPHRLHT